MDAVDFLSTNSVLSVMELTKKPLTTIPENYICPDQEPVLLGLSHDCNTSLPMVPTIELEKLVIGETTDIELDKLHSVCKAWGLFQSYFSELQKLAMTLMELMGKALKIDKREMEELFEDGMRSVRMTYYPPCPQPELVVGFPPHSDATGITILHQVNGVEGLQIKKDGVWIPVSFIPHAFVVNVGDIMEILSNGAYTSAEHRAAVNLEKERISIAVFFNPKSEAEIEPLKSQLNTTQSPPLFRRISVEDFHKEYFFSRDLKDGKTNLGYLRIKTGEGNTD
ncbi:hypothetical protein I3842_10G096900 [Carya illinoinensis]|uniref:Fe2OG dioxygenase domain-containing protein n=1 Tax=Carya illinoinensis TaxID=32201 RepID=A0A922DXM7_CARIL|nr:hypothetical protein I3842_10G096900 [Carya illinoinensis]